jgi:hypothetical protein
VGKVDAASSHVQSYSNMAQGRLKRHVPFALQSQRTFCCSLQPRPLQVLQGHTPLGVACTNPNAVHKGVQMLSMSVNEHDQSLQLQQALRSNGHA